MMGSRDEGKIFPDLTGNPFVDAGIWALTELSEKDTPSSLNINDLKKAKDIIVDLFLNDKWTKNIYSIFPNNPITNPSTKNKRKKYAETLNDLIENIEPLKESGACIGCGRRDFKERIFKDKIPLTGSGAFLNYFSYGVGGADYCPACIFAIQFSPLVMCDTGGRFLILHTSSPKVIKFWVKKPVTEINRQITIRDYSGCYDKGIRNPINALFSIVLEILEYTEVRWEEESPQIQFYRFSNYLQNPELKIYSLPNSVFKFMAKIKKHEEFNEWLKILKRGYINVNWEEIKEREDYVNKRNEVYRRLLDNESILKFFIDNKAKEVYGNWDMLSLYLKEVRNMNQERIETLKKVGDKLSEYIKTTENLKRLSNLERADRYNVFRNQLRLIIKDRIKAGLDEELFTLDEYLENLVPDYRGWKETQDLLLFRIYEKIHGWLVDQQEELEEIKNKEEE